MDKNKNNFNKTAIILGAGPSGLACAYELLQSKSGIKPVIIEKLPISGGLARTIYLNDSGIDIGGHRFITKDRYILSILRKFLKIQNTPSVDDVILQRKRKHFKDCINLSNDENILLIRDKYCHLLKNNSFFDFPIKFNKATYDNLGFSNFINAFVDYIKQYFNKNKPENLEEFFIKNHGQYIYEQFYKDYSIKLWGLDLNEIFCSWAEKRLKGFSFLKRIYYFILSHISYLRELTAILPECQFYYPKYGCSQLWNLMSEYIINNGGEIHFNATFSEMSVNENKIISIDYVNNNEKNTLFGDYFISSIPIRDLIKGIDSPYDIKQNALNLSYRDYIIVSFYVKNFNFKNITKYKTINDIMPDNWIYIQENDVYTSRIQIMNNWSPYLVKDFEKNYIISLEYFTNKNHNLWKLTNEELKAIALSDAVKLNLFGKEDVINSYVLKEQDAYPIYCAAYKNIDKIKKYINEFDNLYLIGRNGRHEYCNMDFAMVCGINIARGLIKKAGVK